MSGPAVIRVDLLRGHNWTSRLICRVGIGPNGWSHAASVLSDGRYLDSRSDTISGVPAGVQVRVAETEMCIARRRFSKIVTQETCDAWEASLWAHKGDPYGTGDIESFILARNLHSRFGFDCSDLAVNALQHAKVVANPLPVCAYQISPNSLELLLAQAGFGWLDLNW